MVRGWSGGWDQGQEGDSPAKTGDRGRRAGVVMDLPVCCLHDVHEWTASMTLRRNLKLKIRGEGFGGCATVQATNTDGGSKEKHLEKREG